MTCATITWLTEQAKKRFIGGEKQVRSLNMSFFLDFPFPQYKNETLRFFGEETGEVLYDNATLQKVAAFSSAFKSRCSQDCPPRGLEC